jgi:hypothetical protein
MSVEVKLNACMTKGPTVYRQRVQGRSSGEHCPRRRRIADPLIKASPRPQNSYGIIVWETLAVDAVLSFKE